MNKTFLIFRQEFLTTLKRTGFIILTAAVPVLGLLAIGIAALVSGTARPPSVQITTIGYIDEEGGFSEFTTQGNIQIVPYTTVDMATRAMVKGDIKEYFVIPQNYSTTGIVKRYTLQKQPAAPPEIVTAIKAFLTSNLLAGKVPPATTSVIESPLNLFSTRLNTSGDVAADQGGYGNLIIPSLFGFLLVLSLTFSSAYLIQGLGEEKENRLIEVLLSSVSTRQLLTGKVVGLGTAGLVQVVVWLVSLPLLVALAAAIFGGFFSSIQIPPNFILLGIVYFILGYFLFAVISAGTGAISPSAREGQQLSSIFTLIAISPLWFSSAILAFPDSPAWVGLTIFPLTAPVVVMLRIGLTGIPAWQLAASIVVLIIAIIVLLLLAVRVLRAYLLMLGKRPRLGEIIRSLRSG
jgi:ABC-2 type transport system permease protein